MLQDARQWLNSGKIEDVRQPRSGATALHVAAAKGYSEVLRYCPFPLIRSLVDQGKMSWVLEAGAELDFQLQCVSFLIVFLSDHAVLTYILLILIHRWSPTLLLSL